MDTKREETESEIRRLTWQVRILGGIAATLIIALIIHVFAAMLVVYDRYIVSNPNQELLGLSEYIERALISILSGGFFFATVLIIVDYIFGHSNKLAKNQVLSNHLYQVGLISNLPTQSQLYFRAIGQMSFVPLCVVIVMIFAIVAPFWSLPIFLGSIALSSLIIIRVDLRWAYFRPMQRRNFSVALTRLTWLATWFRYSPIFCLMIYDVKEFLPEQTLGELVDSLQIALERAKSQAHGEIILMLVGELALIKMRQGQAEIARAELEKLLEAAPHDYYPYYALAQFNLEQNLDPEQALKWLNTALTLIPKEFQSTPANCLACSSWALMRMGRVNDGLQYVQATLEKVTNKPFPAAFYTTYLVLGRAYVEIGEMEEARHYWRTALELNPDGFYTQSIRKELAGLA